LALLPGNAVRIFIILVLFFILLILFFLSLIFFLSHFFSLTFILFSLVSFLITLFFLAQFLFEEFCWEICETSWETLWLRKDKVLKLSIETHLSFLEGYSTSFQLISFQKTSFKNAK